MCNLFLNVDIHIDFFIGYLTLIRQEKGYHKEQKMQVINEIAFVNAKGYLNIVVYFFFLFLFCVLMIFLGLES